MRTELSLPAQNGSGEPATAIYYSLPKLAEALDAASIPQRIAKLPVSIRTLLESVLRGACQAAELAGQSSAQALVSNEAIAALANWGAGTPEQAATEVPFKVARVVLQDFTGVPLLVDLAAMRDAAAAQGADPTLIEPVVPVDLVVDHSVQVDFAGRADAFNLNVEKEFERNAERYAFLKWGQQAFKTFGVVPPAVGIVHQVNLEYLASVVFEETIDPKHKAEGDNGSGETLLYPDSLVGTDSHTTMINGLGVVGWGVGGIEAESAMLGQPMAMAAPEVIGVHLTGTLTEGVTATDLTLTITQMLRAEGVVGKFVEFYGEGAAALSLADRATIANMAPEYGATMGFFPVDEKTLDYLRLTGRSEDKIQTVKTYLEAQELFGMPGSAGKPELTYTKALQLNMGSIVPSVAGPKRPQDRVDVPALKACMQQTVAEAAVQPVALKEGETPANIEPAREITNGSVVIAAITSCTNTSNPSVMVAAGLLAKNALAKGLQVPAYVKTSLAPGSRVVTDYLEKSGLQQPLDALGFQLVGYGCTTCIGNSGPLDADIEQQIKTKGIVAASVLSGNRNFEARVHGAVGANFLMSPPLVVAYALAGKVDINLDAEPLGKDADGNDVHLKDIWPTQADINKTVAESLSPDMFTSKYAQVESGEAEHAAWQQTQAATGPTVAWSDDSTYIQHPPFLEGFTKDTPSLSSRVAALEGETGQAMRPLLLLGDSVTTDHISPAGAIIADGPAGQYLQKKGVDVKNFNSFGSRRGNDRIMTRGTFANVRIQNLMLTGNDARPGGYTRHIPSGEIMSVFDAAQAYKKAGTPLIVVGGADYGMGSSRDWAAKGTALLGVQAVLAKSFERIHRSNLIGMGVLPLTFLPGEDKDTLALTGEETFAIPGLASTLAPGATVAVTLTRANATTESFNAKVGIQTDAELETYQHGGILPAVLCELLSA